MSAQHQWHAFTAGALEKARKSMIHQQPGGLASHLRGSVIRTNSALPPTALAGPQACSALHQSSARAPKHAQHAQHATPSSWPQPGSAPAAVTGEVSKGDHSGDSVTSSRPRGTIASLQEANGMSWNPVRLTSPFESATEPATGIYPFPSLL